MVLNIGYESDASLDEVIRFRGATPEAGAPRHSLMAHDFDAPGTHMNITLAETVLCLKPGLVLSMVWFLDPLVISETNAIAEPSK